MLSVRINEREMLCILVEREMLYISNKYTKITKTKILEEMKYLVKEITQDIICNAFIQGPIWCDGVRTNHFLGTDFVLWQGPTNPQNWCVHQTRGQLRGYIQQVCIVFFFPYSEGRQPNPIFWMAPTKTLTWQQQ